MWSALRDGARKLADRCGDRKIQHEAGPAAPGAGARLDRAADRAQDAVADPQAEAAALAERPRGEERIEDLVADLLGDAVAGVLDLDPHDVVAALGADP